MQVQTFYDVTDLFSKSLHKKEVHWKKTKDQSVSRENIVGKIF